MVFRVGLCIVLGIVLVPIILGTFSGILSTHNYSMLTIVRRSINGMWKSLF